MARGSTHRISFPARETSSEDGMVDQMELACWPTGSARRLRTMHLRWWPPFGLLHSDAEDAGDIISWALPQLLASRSSLRSATLTSLKQ